MSLDGTVSIVTGGGRGIGRVVAKFLAAAGSKVAVIARSPTELAQTVSQIEAEGGQAAAWTVDVTNRIQVEAAVSEIEATLGPVSTLVNNAGNNLGTGPLWLTDPEAWWLGLEVNLRGPYLLSRAVLPGMIERGSGRIINIGSNAAIRPVPMATAYSCSKAALLRLTDSLAESVKGLGVQVFAISPGWVWTAMTRRAVAEMERNIPDFEGIPDSETSPPELAAELVVSLAEGAGDMLTGRYIHVRDDFNQMIQNAEQIVAEDLQTLRLTRWEPDEGS